MWSKVPAARMRCDGGFSEALFKVKRNWID